MSTERTIEGAAPLAGQRSDPPADVHPARAYLDRSRVLLVDDNAADRELVARELRLVAPLTTIIPVRDPQELDAALAADAYDLVITDYQLFWSTGLEVLERIKQRQPRKPVIMFTASGSEELAVAAMKKGLDDYITKALKHYGRLPYAAAAALERVHIRRELEDALSAQKQALLAEVKRKNEFLATLAHELRNPLAPIRYAVKLISQQASPEVLHRAREMIERQSLQMARLLDDLLDFSRITLDVIELRREIVDLRHVVEESALTARPIIESFNHRLALDVAGEPLWVDCDVARLSQVIGNLLDNAAKYTDAGGRIEVRASSEGQSALVHVRDTGIGLTEPASGRVFELFSRVHPPSRGQVGGLGIGLAVVKKLVELHGGTVSVHSDGEGLGSTFTVSLPMCGPPTMQEAGQGKTQRAPSAANSSRRVLIVDDNPDVVDSLALYLRSQGRDVHLAYDARHAMELATRVHPQVVLLDLGMPRVDGYGLARWIRSQPWGSAALLVAITGWGQEEDRRRTNEAGFDRHLVKPVDPELLLQLIDGE
jgi:signal transduction histidine kinase